MRTTCRKQFCFVPEQRARMCEKGHKLLSKIKIAYNAASAAAVRRMNTILNKSTRANFVLHFW